MQFCDECGSMMHKQDDGEMVCQSCGATAESEADEVLFDHEVPVAPAEILDADGESAGRADGGEP